MCLVAVLAVVFLARADEYTASSFRVLDPVLAPGGFSSSTDFQLFGSLGEPGLGTSTATSFGLRSAFLYFPVVATPVVAATAGNTSVALAWTAVTASLGWTVGGYNVGQATVSGGPYSYASLGNVTSATRSSLTNGTPYYFVVRVEDALGYTIATSTEVSATPVASGGGAGGGGGGSETRATGVNLSGHGYPLSKVTILKDGQIIAVTIAGPDAKFEVTQTGLSAGQYLFAVYGEDNEGRRSSLFTFPVYLTTGVVTNISGIFLAPTIDVDKSEVKYGDNLAIFGQATASSTVTIAVNSNQEIFIKTPSDRQGLYLYNFDTTLVERGNHITKAKVALGNEISPFGTAVNFYVGDKNILIEPGSKCPKRGDLNGDCRVNLIDFSIAAYWYHRPLSAAFIPREKAVLNGDGKVDLVDFSIMAYYWTG